MMKLWLIRPIDRQAPPWDWYDMYYGAVIRAETEGEARSLMPLGDEASDTSNPWLDASLSSCEELVADGPKEVVLADFLAG